MSSLLLVCTANLCRSPMAEVVFKALAGPLLLTRVASAGVYAPQRGQPMDGRAFAALQRRQYEPSKKWRSHAVQDADFESYDRILAMDADNLAALSRRCPPVLHHKLGMFMDLLPGQAGSDLVDPYFTGVQGFENVLDQIEACARAQC